MHSSRVNILLTTATAWLFLIATTLMGVDSAREEAAPVEQYNDSGDTIRQPDGLLVPTSIALQSLLTTGDSDDAGNTAEAGSESEAEMLKRAAPTWSQFYGGYGKRERDIQFTDPEGDRNWNRLFGLVGKRAQWHDLSGIWGKRGQVQWNSLNGGWGKRGWMDLSHGYGKRAPHWNNLRGMWG